MAHFIMVKTNMIDLLELEQIDLLAFFLSCFMHDFKHDGHTNPYHVNSMSDVAIKYNDVSVLENYHVAQTFKIFSNEETNIIGKLSQ